MIPVYGRPPKSDFNIFLQSYLVPMDDAISHLKTDSYDVHGSLVPGVTVYASWNAGDSEYFRFGNTDGIEPLVVIRDFNGLATDSVEIAEEFRLLFNLYYNSSKNEYIDLENDTIVAKVEGDFVCIQKRYLKSYLALKNMAMILHIDSRYMSADSKEDWPPDELSFNDGCNNIIYTLTINKGGVYPQSSSLLYGKKVIFGCSLKDCNVWPYNQEKVIWILLLALAKMEKKNIILAILVNCRIYLEPIRMHHIILPLYFSMQLC